MRAGALFLFLILPCICFAGPLPYSEEITKAMDTLEYSGFYVLVKPEVTLNIDFAKRQWTLGHVHQFDKEGKLILDENRYGLCAELATFVYQQIQPILDNRYSLEFAMATQKYFFPTSESNHIVLLMLDQQTKESYLIDPSFHKYGKIKELREYEIISIQEGLSFVKEKAPDVSFMANQAVPLVIRNDLLLTFSTITVDEKFDKENYLFIIQAIQRYKFLRTDIMVAGKYGNRPKFYVNQKFLGELLSEDEINQLISKFKGWIEQIEMK